MTTSPESLSFGNVNVGTTSTGQDVTITNNGTASLTFSAAFISGAADYVLTGDTSTPIGAGGSRQATVQCKPTALGSRPGTLRISGDDPANPSDDISLSCTGVAPEMNVTGLGVSIADEDTVPSVSDNTDFGSANVTGGMVQHIFRIQNTGTGPLNLTGTPKVAISGTNSGDFTVLIQPSSPIAAGTSFESLSPNEFYVQFDPSATGVRTATISIANDDADENPYNFSIQGTARRRISRSRTLTATF
jgi:hypothetical protein